MNNIIPDTMYVPRFLGEGRIGPIEKLVPEPGLDSSPHTGEGECAVGPSRVSSSTVRR